MKLLALAVTLFSVAAAPVMWEWHLPPGVAPPPLPAGNAMSAARVALGRRLFYDADLSIDGTMACATCHEQRHGFADGNATRPGVHGDPGRRNVPGLANVAWRRSLTWGDPRITTLEAQALVPIAGLHPVEMGMAGNEAEIPRRLARDACYRRQFRAAFPATRGRIDMAAVARALAAFERSLVSFDAPADRAAPSGVAAIGATLFARDCAACHAGHDLTDDAFHALRPVDTKDRGLGEITGDPRDDGRFRTPSLRNVAVTGPWLHDGSAPTLAAAIAAHPGQRSPGEVAALIAYLETRTDRAFLTDPRFAYPDAPCSGSARSAPRSVSSAGAPSTAPSIAASSAR